MRSARPIVLIGGLTALVAPSLLFPGSAQASLGGGPASVAADRTHLAAALRSGSAAGRTLHTLTLPNGAAQREFARSDGVIFAIAWQGRSRPDLRQLMGAYFDGYNARVSSSGVRRARRPIEVRSSDLIVHSSGHAGAFWGFAYAPALAPAGFSIAELAPSLTR